MLLRIISFSSTNVNGDTFSPHLPTPSPWFTGLYRNRQRCAMICWSKVTRCNMPNESFDRSTIGVTNGRYITLPDKSDANQPSACDSPTRLFVFFKLVAPSSARRHARARKDSPFGLNGWRIIAHDAVNPLRRRESRLQARVSRLTRVQRALSRNEGMTYKFKIPCRFRRGQNRMDSITPALHQLASAHSAAI